jgi:polyisoprenoid-binding protein YceI
MTANATARTFTIDKTHSEIQFQVRHLVGKVRGRFGDFEGTILADEQDPARSSVTVSVKAASIDTNQADRDAHLRSADFFDVERFPTLSFVSASVTPAGGNTFTVTGDLTIHGVTNRVSVPVTFLGKARDPWGNERAGFESEFTVNRKDYGLTWNAALETGGLLVGEEVTISLTFEAIAA